ncbi:DUF2304 family protein [Patescibacteria group bacterium]|nr:DUF2304 family protein [Patescibacteria group bacterium]MBU1921769.1 DUF2304 family protein [Patescibacteria group bacterium]
MVIQIVIIAFVLFAIARVFLKFRAKEFSVSWLLIWIIFWLGAGVVVLLPKTTEVAAAWFGVGRGVDLVIYISISVLFYLVFKIFTKIQSLDKNISKVVQGLALAEPREPNESKQEEHASQQ